MIGQTEKTGHVALTTHIIQGSSNVKETRCNRRRQTSPTMPPPSELDETRVVFDSLQYMKT